MKKLNSINLLKAEFYTLVEACEYLNAKHNTSVTPIKLLKQIVSYNIPAYVYGKGFDFYSDTDITKTNVDISYINIAHKIENYLNEVNSYDGLFLRIPVYFLEKLTFSSIKNNNKVSVFDFDGVLSVQDLGGDSQSLKFISDMMKDNENIEFSCDGIFLSPMVLIPDLDKMIDDGLIKDGKPLPKKILKQYTKTVSLPISENKVHDFKLLYENLDGIQENIKKGIDINFFIGIDDLVIMDNDLQILENYLLNCTPYPPRNSNHKPSILPQLKGEQPLYTKSKHSAAKIIRALLEIGEFNLDKPYEYDSPNSTCRIIYDHLQSIGLPLNNRTISEWLKTAKELDMDKDPTIGKR